MKPDKKVCFEYEYARGTVDTSARVKIMTYELGEDKRYAVVFEDGLTGIFSDEEFFAFGLYDTEEPLLRSYDELACEVNLKRAYLAANSFLRGSLKPEKTVEEKLSEEGFENDVIREVMLRLREEAAVDDMKYAMRFVRKRLDAGNTSRRALAMELREKGISEEVAALCVEELEVDDKALAANIIAKKLRMGDNPEKIKRYLAGKGFSVNVIIRAFENFDLPGAASSDEEIF